MFDILTHPHRTLCPSLTQNISKNSRLQANHEDKMFGLTATIAYTIKDLPNSLGDKAFAFALNHFYDVQALSPKDLIELKRLSFMWV